MAFNNCQCRDFLTGQFHCDGHTIQITNSAIGSYAKKFEQCAYRLKVRPRFHIVTVSFDFWNAYMGGDGL